MTDQKEKALMVEEMLVPKMHLRMSRNAAWEVRRIRTNAARWCGIEHAFVVNDTADPERITCPLCLDAYYAYMKAKML